MRQPVTREFLRNRPVVRRATRTHHQIRRYGDVYLVWPDGRTTPDTAPIATTRDLQRALELARRFLVVDTPPVPARSLEPISERIRKIGLRMACERGGK
jgi:hypothetical protein